MARAAVAQCRLRLGARSTSARRGNAAADRSGLGHALHRARAGSRSAAGRVLNGNATRGCGLRRHAAAAERPHLLHRERRGVVPGEAGRVAAVRHDGSASSSRRSRRGCRRSATRRGSVSSRGPAPGSRSCRRHTSTTSADPSRRRSAAHASPVFALSPGASDRRELPRPEGLGDAAAVRASCSPRRGRRAFPSISPRRTCRPQSWQAYGQAIKTRHIAARPS